MARRPRAHEHRPMKYRHEQMIRARARRRAPEPWQRLEAALWDSLTADERRLWRSYSQAVAQVRPS
jgi:predicted amidohydrolase YtcJ